MGNSASKSDSFDTNKKVRSLSSPTVIGVILLLVLLGFGIAIIVTSKKSTGATNACSTLTPPTSITPLSTIPGVVNVSWTAISGATSYKVYRSSSNTVTTTSYDEVKAVTVGTSVNFTSLTSPTQAFIVTSINDCGESTASATSSIQMNCVLAAVTNLTLVANSNNTASATWDLVPYATEYKIFTLVNDVENTQVVQSDINTYAISGSGTITIGVNGMNSCSEGSVVSATIII